MEQTAPELYAFQCGSFQAPLTFFVKDRGADAIKVPVLAWLIRHPKHGLALFDTGLGLRWRQDVEAEIPAGGYGFHFREKDALSAQMRTAGFDPADVRWIINSHLHGDHCGDNGSFPNATIVVQRREKEAGYAALGGAYAGEDFDTGQPFLPVDGEHDLYGDGSVVLLPTYGHTPGHQSARVRLASGEVVLTADCCYFARNLEMLDVPNVNVDREASVEVLRRLAAMQAKGTRLLFGHDPWQAATLGLGKPIR